MKTLKESLLSNIDDTLNQGDSNCREAVKKFLWDNYNGSYTIPMKPNKDGIFEITFKTRMAVINKDITELTNGLFMFGDCKGEFDCSHCHNLTSLKGSPRTLDTFNCSFCPKLTSLKDGPEKVYNTYYCNNCGLTSLEGSPQINYGFNCCGNPLKNLKGASKKVNAKFICSYCPELKTLEGCPEYVKGWFDCSNCPKLELESLKKYFPKKIEDDFMCISNFKDKTVEEKNELRDYLYHKLGNDIEMILV